MILVTVAYSIVVSELCMIDVYYFVILNTNVVLKQKKCVVLW